MLVSPLVQLRAVVDGMARGFDFTYPWTAAADAAADRLDFVARAADLARGPAVLLVTGEDDDATIREPAAALTVALRDDGLPDERLRHAAVPGMGHALADEPGTAQAPQTPQAAAVDRLATEWLRAHLDARS